MEEITKSQIARLVLGYLKKENYNVAYSYFYKQCPYFEKYRQKMFKFSTRYNGLALEDILYQYSEIYSIIQPCLEDTDYFEDKSYHKEELPQQLLYLLDHARSTSGSKSPGTGNINHTESNADSSLLDLSLNLNRISHTPESDNQTASKCLPASLCDKQEQLSSGGQKIIAGEIVESFKEIPPAHEEQHAHGSDANNLWNQSTACEGGSAVKTSVNRTDTNPVFETLVEDGLGNVPALKLLSNASQPAFKNAVDKNVNHENVIVIDSKGSVVNSQAAFVNMKNLPSTSAAVNLSLQEKHAHDLTEQDIMSMPVFVCDERHEEKVMVEQGVQVPERRLKTLLPVRKATKSVENIADYITLYKCDNNEDDYDTEITHGLNPNASMQSFATIQVLPVNETGIDNNMNVENKTPEKAMQANKSPAPTPRSGNRSSHVRALDFKFATPAKEVRSVTQSGSTPPRTYVNKHKASHAQRSSKLLFNNATKLKEPWDMKFRSVLMIPTPNCSEISVLPNAEKKGTKKAPNENIDRSNNTNSTKTLAKVTKKKKNPSKKSRQKQVPAANATSNNKVMMVTDVALMPNNACKSKIFHNEVNENDMASSNCIQIINIDKPPTYNKKCNTNTKKEVKVVISKESTTIEKVADSDKLVLSPSKLNGNKRSLMESDVIKCETILTPEVEKLEPTEVPCSSTMRNIIPILRTPGKDICPETPCVYSTTAAEDTPFTKVFNEQMTGVDIASIPTPKILMTPNFPFTPFMEAHQTPSNNRPTDYSTSSSYYQPSDTEQSKSLEKLVQECQRLENEKANEEENCLSIEPALNTTAVENVKTLTKNVIARKNLNLIKSESHDEKDGLDVSIASTSSDSSSSSSSDSSSSDSDDCELIPNETTTQKHCSGYSLRSRHPDGRNKTPIVKQTMQRKATSSTENKRLSKKISNSKAESSENHDKTQINNIVNNVQFIPALQDTDCIEDKGKSKILSDLELKKLRVLRDIKSDIAENSAKRVPRSSTQKKKLPAKLTRVTRSTTAKLKDEDLYLSSSEEDNNVRPFEIVETELLCSNSNTSVLAENDDDEKKLKSTQNPEDNILANCIANSPVHDEVIVGTCLVVVNTKEECSSKKSVSVKSGANRRQEARKRTDKTLKQIGKFSHAAQVISNERISSEREFHNDKPGINCVSEEDRMCDNAVESTIKKEVRNIDVETLNKRSLQGTTGEEAKKLVEGLWERGINLIENRNPNRFVHENLHAEFKNDVSPSRFDKPLLFYQKEDKIGRCISTINSSEDEIIYYDVNVFTEPIFIDGTEVQKNENVRDYADDNFRLTKSYGMTVYDDATDMEVEKIMHVTPFDCIFDYHMVQNVKADKKTKVKVIKDVLITSNKPGSKIYNITKNKETSSATEIENQKNLVPESMYAETSRSSNKFVIGGTPGESDDNFQGKVDRPAKSKLAQVLEADKKMVSDNFVNVKKRKFRSFDDNVDDDEKKIKLDDQRLLQEVDVDDLLEKFYG